MTPVRTTTEKLASGATLLRQRMTAPRANALEPGLLAALHEGLDRAEAAGAQAVLIEGGRNFSTGGDVARFLDASRRGVAEEYATALVSDLQRLLLRLIDLPAVIAVAARGAITGGSAGMLFASDIAFIAPDAFVQPWYSHMGFAPDGGWTAILPDRIGAGRALSWLLSDMRLEADDAKTLGLAARICAEPETALRDHLDRIDLGTALAAKDLIWTKERRARVAAALDAETAAFRRLIGRGETRARMENFVTRQDNAHA